MTTSIEGDATVHSHGFRRDPRPAGFFLLRGLIRSGSTLALIVVCAAGTQAQQTATPQNVPSALTLDQAIGLARQNNPVFLQTRNDETDANWAVKQAYGQLLPTGGINGDLSYQASGTPRFGFFTGSDLGISRTPAYLSSDYSLGVQYSLSGTTLYAPSQAKSNRRATYARSEAADFQLTSDVTRMYLSVLRAQDAVALALREQARAVENLKLANARVTVGAAIPLDAKQAEVDKIRTDVALLSANSDLKTAKLRLMQQVGLEMSNDVQLTSTFAVKPIAYTEADLLKRAIDMHPTLRALRAAEDASKVGVTVARTAYMPSLNFSAGLSGYTRQASDAQYLVNQAQTSALGSIAQCQQLNAISAGLKTPLPGYPQNCNALALTPAQQQAVISGNNVFPFNFTGQPWVATLSLNLPVWTGFTRERNVESARVAADDARLRVRAEELQLRADISSAYDAVQTAQQSFALEESNRSLADDQLRLARERYRLGQAAFLELRDAETTKAVADRDYLAAEYSYHENLAALEAAVGQRLTQTTQPQR
jgi:outer membrane protein